MPLRLRLNRGNRGLTGLSGAEGIYGDDGTGRPFRPMACGFAAGAGRRITPGLRRVPDLPSGVRYVVDGAGSRDL